MNLLNKWITTLLSFCAILAVVFAIVSCGGQAATEDPTKTNQAPQAVLLASVSRGVVPLTVEFSAANSSDTDGSINTYDWTFDDGEVGQGSVIEHTFNAAGVYGVTLNVIDDEGAVGSEVVWITVLEANATFSLYGTVTAMPYMDIDGDTNDPEAPFFNNDGNDDTQVQPLTVPVILNGYLTLGATSNSGDVNQTSNDLTDVYVFDAEEGQFASLQLVNTATADVDLYLFDAASMDLIASSTNEGEYESIRIPASGQYWLMVQINSGTSKYLLKIGQDSFLSGAQSIGESGDFEPLQAVVKLNESDIALPQVIRDAQIDLSHTNRKRECLARFSNTNPQTSARLKMLPQQGVEQLLASANPEALAKLQTLKTIKTLRKQTGVKVAELNYRVRAKLTPNDTLYRYQWNLPAMNVPQAWDTTTGDANTVIAVIDSGVVASHPELEGQLVAGYDFISNPDGSNDGDGIDPDPTDPGDSASLSASSWHGTHVSGALVSKLNNGEGIVGIAASAKVMPLRVLGLDGGSVYDVLQAVRYAAGLENDSGTVPADTADIINLSLGGPGYSQTASDVYQQVRAKGIFVVAAAGNENSQEPMYPASYNGVVSVSAYDYAGDRAPYSNYNAYVDVAAPGGNLAYDLNRDGYGDGILSLTLVASNSGLSSNYAFYQGTSIAAPQVAGVIALMKAVNPNLTPQQFDSLLINGEISHDVGQEGHDIEFGYGAIDALLAVQAAESLAEGGTTSAMIASPSSLVFNANTNAMDINLAQIGNQNITVVSATFSDDWLDAVPLNVDGNGFGDYRISVNRDGLPYGNYSGQVTFMSSAGNFLDMNVNMRVGDIVETGNAGYIYIMLIDANTDQTVASLGSTGMDGEYAYQFEDVLVGDYYIVAGTDINHDGMLCDPGEICGYYPSFNQRSIISLVDDKPDMNFTTGLYTDTFATQAVVIQPANFQNSQLLTSLFSD